MDFMFFRRKTGGGTQLEQAARLRRSGDFAAARKVCEELLRASPGDFAALDLMAGLCADLDDARGGLEWAGRAAAANPAAAGPCYTAGRCHQMAANLPGAEACYRRALEIDPRHVRAHNNLGSVLLMQSRLDEAADAFRAALAIDPDLAQALQNLAGIMRDRAMLERAAAAYRRLADARPDDAYVRNDLGNVYRELGLHRESLAAFDEALRLNPELEEAHFSRSMELLLLGELAAGWRGFEYRFNAKASGTQPRALPGPRWDGAPLRGALLLHAEQGLGDTLQFVRYARLAAARCGEVILECQPPLAELLRPVEGISRVVARGEPLPPFDAHLPLLSAPGVFGTTLENVPWSGPYVRADAERTAQWRRAIAAAAPGAALNVGLCWAGNPLQWDDRKRSTTLDALGGLRDAPGVAFHSLQVGYAAAQADQPPPGMRIVSHSERLRDFRDTAALVEALDLVISVCTSVAHLAGAMGRPTFIMLAHAPDWRWHLGRDDSPWYPGMRLFRQKFDDDWSGVVADVVQALIASKPFR
jgi:tetratricopeptide (TPR) repeat protein